MSSSEEYLDSLLDSILGNNQSNNEPRDKNVQVPGEVRTNTEAGKAMSEAEIEEMLVSMGTLGKEESETVPETVTEAFLDDAPMEGLALDDVTTEELSLDDVTTEEVSLEDMATEELTLDELSLDDVTTEELSLDDVTTEEVSLEDMATEELTLDELSLDDVTTEEVALEDMAAEELSLDELSLEDMATEELSLDDISIDELSLDEQPLEELPLEETGEEEPEGGMEIEELDLSESGGLEDLVLEEHMMDEMEAPDDESESLMSEEDIDRLLNGEDSGGDFALEESEEDAEDNDDLSALLAGMDHDEDLSEINNLLDESDQGVSTDDDILAMLEGAEDENGDSFDFFESDEAAREAESIRELTPEEIAAREKDSGEKSKKEKKKRKKLFGRKKKESAEEEAEDESAETGTELEDLLGLGDEEPEKPVEEKKPGLGARIMNLLFESDEEDEDPLAAEILADNAGETGTVTDENKELLEELNAEDKKGKKKKKKDKKKGKKGKGAEGEEGAEGAEGEEGTEDKKAKKKKKKEKKAKKEAEIDLLAPPEKKLSKKKVLTVFVFCGTIAACIILLSTFLPNYMQKRDAHIAYDHGDYDDVFRLLYDKERSEQDEVLFQRSNIVLQMERKLNSYNNYVNLDMRLEALNALISGVSRYQKLLPEAEKYNVVDEVSDSYAQILEKLSTDFGVSEEQALEIIASEDDVTYSQRLEAIISGALYEEDVPAGRQDVLPEEEEIIERIEGLE